VHHRHDESILLFREHLEAWHRKTRVEQVWEVTAAGVLVLQLLVEAGLIVRVDIARTRYKAAEPWP